MPLRKRDQYTHWLNEEPIADVYEALHLLKPQWGDPFGEKTRYLAMDKSPAELHIQWFADGDSGGASSGIHYLDIAPAVVEHLQKGYWVRPHMEVGWGYSRPNLYKLVISDHAKLLFNEYIERTREEARKSLVAGEHSRFSGIFNDAGSGREHGRCGGRLYFDFVTPMKERVRVYPDTKEVKKLEPLKV